MFAGIAFAAIGIGALVPAAIMSIAAANLWTRNIYKEYLHKGATPGQEARQAKLASLVVKFGAVAFILFVDPQFSIDLQLIGGVIILQTLPSVAIALYTRWLHRWALIAGWVVGMGYGMYLLYLIPPNPANGKAHFGGSALTLDKLTIFGWHPFAGSTVQIYVGFVALVVNLAVAVVVSAALRAGKVSNGADQTDPADYHADEDSPRLKPVADAVAGGFRARRSSRATDGLRRVPEGRHRRWRPFGHYGQVAGRRPRTVRRCCDHRSALRYDARPMSHSHERPSRNEGAPRPPQRVTSHRRNVADVHDRGGTLRESARYIL